MRKKLVAIYVRVSTQEQAEHGYSVDEQTERAKKFCEAMGWTVYKVYTDAGFSGANTERPALQQLIKDVERKKIGKVLVYKLDRLSRSQLDTLYLIEKVFLVNDTDFVSMSENFDTSTPFGKAMVGILAVFAQLEREQIKERMSMGKKARAKQGKYHGGSLSPIGYDYANGELQTNDYEKLQIKMIYGYYLSGLSTWKVAQKMTEAGYEHKHGKWTADRVRLAIKSRLYVGYIQHNGEWYQGEHEAFVDEATYEKAQRVMDKRRAEHKHNARHGKASTYLSGYVFCGCCGARYQKETRKYHGPNGTTTYEWYKCNSRVRKKVSVVKDENCKNKTWHMNELDDLILGEIRKLAIDPEYIASIRSENTEDEKPQVITAEIKKLEDQIARVMDLYTIGQMPLDILQDKIHALNDKKIKLEHELAELAKNKTNSMSKDQALQLAKSFGAILDRGDLDEIRSVISALIEKIEINGDDITIYWTFA